MNINVSRGCTAKVSKHRADMVSVSDLQQSTGYTKQNGGKFLELAPVPVCTLVQPDRAESNHCAALVLNTFLGLLHVLGSMTREAERALNQS